MVRLLEKKKNETANTTMLFAFCVLDAVFLYDLHCSQKIPLRFVRAIIR